MHLDQIKKEFKLHFEGIFEPALVDEVLKKGIVKLHEADETLIEIGEQITFMPLVLSGSIKIMTEDKEGDELLLYYLEFGDTCAVTLKCCTTKAKSTVKGITETQTTILYIPIAELEIWMVKYPSWRNFILDSYNARLHEMISAIDNIVFNSLEERLKRYLKDKVWVTKNAVLHVSHQEIANDLHSSRVVISRLMKKLEKENLISQTRNKVTFLEFFNI